ncbi:hypothetical protein BC835DRAFT_1419110 [Cytidiella melzeri]|nr:hypothetical protein BC835DRAFT_1419110 [Cytidiella melzeri]
MPGARSGSAISRRRYHTFMDFWSEREAGFLEEGIIVPQKIYSARWEFGPEYKLSPVEFKINGRNGINIRTASSARALDGAQSIVNLPHKTQIKVRIHWPGYEPYETAVSIKPTAPSRGLTLREFAKKLTDMLRRFLLTYSKTPSTELGGDWAIQRYTNADVYLLRLEHVSTGSWQPVLSVDPWSLIPHSPT